MGLFGKKKEDKTLAPLDGDGTFTMNVVGESFYMNDITAVIRSAPKDQQQAGRVQKIAVLWPDPKNQYDPRAIAVIIDGKKVGHVPKTDLDLVHEVVETVNELGYKYPAVQAILTWNAAAGPKIVGVFYDLKYDRTPLTPDQRPASRVIEGKSRPLKTGTQVTLTDVDEALVAEIRASKPREPQVGHVVDVACMLDAKGDVWAYVDGVPLGRMDPDLVNMYREQFRTLFKRGEVGTTVAFVKWDGAKSPHSLSLNWSNDGIL
jgi:hypothetical protein